MTVSRECYGNPSSLHTVEGFCFEIEQPHGCMNTMDVSVYSTWLYMINWPEVERRDLEQYVAAIPTEGETAGKVWHSLWADGALWLPCHEGARQGATVSGLFEEAMEAVLERGADAWEEVQRMRSAVGMLP